MALKIRLARAGAKKRPFYHIVIADARSPRDGRFVEKVGSYNPMLPQDHQERVRLKVDRLKYWISVGAQPTDRVALFLGKASLIKMPEMRETPQKSAPKAKMQERAQAAIEAANEKKEAAQQVAAEESAAPEAPPEEVSEKAPVEEAVQEAPAEESAPTEEAAPAEGAAAETESAEG